MRTLSSLTLALVATAAVVGCQSDATAPPTDQTPPLALSVAPSVALINGGKFLRLVATVRHADGSTATPTDVTWSSANGAIASVASDGLVQGLSAGKVQIVATWHDSRGSSLVTVVEPVAKKPPPKCLEPSQAGIGAEALAETGCD
jgi:uncharacterized protein YjdB